MNLLLQGIINAVFQLLLFALIPFICWLINARKKENFLSWNGLKKPAAEGKISVAVITAAVIAAVYAVSMTLVLKILPEGVTTAGSTYHEMGKSAIPAVIVYAFIQTSLSEELIFRGFILKRIAVKSGFAVANAVQAVLFGLLHGIPFYGATQDIKALIICTLLPGGLGAFLGWLNEKKFSGSIVPGWIIHAVLNTVTGIIQL